jgi:S-adenosylmethionine uptake transporter
MHLRRGAVGTVSLGLWFFATAMLPLGTATALNYTSSLFLAAFAVGAALRARRPVQSGLAFVIVLGFVGVLLLLQPNFSAGQWLGAAAGLISGMLSALAYWHVRELALRGEPEWRIVFYFSASALTLGVGGSLLTGFSVHTPVGVALLATVGISALLAQLAMTRAFSRGRALFTASLSYSSIVFASILGVVVFADHVTFAGWIGMAIIIGSGVLATFIAQRRRPPRIKAPLTVKPS